MSLNICLRPGEKVIVNGALLCASGRVRIAVENQAAILRGSDIMSEEQCTSPARRLYFATMLAYIDEEHLDAHRSAILAALREAMAGPISDVAKVICARFAAHVAIGAFYRGLGDCRALMAIEDEAAAEAQAAE